MLHGRVVRPVHGGGARAAVDDARGRSACRVSSQIVRDGRLRRRRRRARGAGRSRAARALVVTLVRPRSGCRPRPRCTTAMRSAPATDATCWSMRRRGAARSRGRGRARGEYRCALPDARLDRALLRGRRRARRASATIWTGTPGVFALRGALAELLGLAPEQSAGASTWRASGCYGHNGADDAAADAALLSQAVGPAGARAVDARRRARLGAQGTRDADRRARRAGRRRQRRRLGLRGLDRPPIRRRPGGRPGNLLAGQAGGRRADAAARSRTVGGRPQCPARLRLRRRPRDRARPGSGAAAGVGAARSRRAAQHLRQRVLHGRAGARRPAPTRSSSGSATSDDRARSTCSRRRRRAAGWQARPSAGAAARPRPHGRGIAFAQYENAHAYVPRSAEVEVDRGSGAVRVRRVAVATTAGSIVNPDGVRNQIEGNVLQAHQPDAQGGGDARRTPASPASTGPPTPSSPSPKCPTRSRSSLIDRPGQAAARGRRAGDLPDARRHRQRRLRRHGRAPARRCRSRPRASARSSPAHEPSPRPQPGTLRVEQLPSAAPHHRPRRHGVLRDPGRRRRLLQGHLHP